MTKRIGLANEELEIDHHPSSMFNIILEKREIIQLTTVPGAPAGDLLTWASKDEEIATVNEVGTVTAIDVGKTQILVENQRQTFADRIGIKVVEAGEAETLRLAIRLNFGEVVRLSLEGVEQPIWQSLDNSIAVVSQTGEVTGISEGLALITATHGEEMQVIYVMVTGRPIDESDLADTEHFERIKEIVISNNNNPIVESTRAIGSFLSGGNKWAGGVVAPNGKIYGIPANNFTVLEIDPETMATTTFGNVGAEADKWFGGVLANNGKVYGIPSTSASILEINPETRETILFGNAGAGEGKWRGGVLAPNGRIYGIPSNETRVIEINPETKEIFLFGNVGIGTNKWEGGVLAPNGKIYGIPRNATTILEIDPEARTATSFGSVGTGINKWVGGVLAANGKIYGIPHNSTEVLEIDPIERAANTFGSIANIALKWVGGVLLPNGKIYGIPHTATSILEVDPVTRTIRLFGDLAGTQKWRGGTLAPNGRVYSIPFDATSSREMDFGVELTNFDTTALLSTWINNY